MSQRLILFIHGLGGNVTSTWGKFPYLIRNDKILSKATVAHFSYPTGVFNIPFLSKYSGINTLAQALSSQIEHRFHSYQEISLVCHSLGGLIAKQYLIDSFVKGRPNSVKQAIFFAMPHNGAMVASLGRLISPWHPHLRGLCKDSEAVRSISQLWSYSKAAELVQSHYIVAAQDRVVDELSSRSAWGNTEVDVIVDRGHVDCVKPIDEEDMAFLITKNLLTGRRRAEAAASVYFDDAKPGRIGSPTVVSSVETRIAVSALLKVERGGKYLLIRNAHRPEAFSPIGGVFKFLRNGWAKLDEFEFRPEHVSEMQDDVRGYIKSSSLEKFKAWLATGEGRETSSECLIRELIEELDEISRPSPFPSKRIRFRRIRTIVEEPQFIPALGKVQYRIFEIHEFDDGDLPKEEMVDALAAAGVGSKDLIWATADEMKRGRHLDGGIIGSHAPYLFGTERYRGDDAMFHYQ